MQEKQRNKKRRESKSEKRGAGREMIIRRTLGTDERVGWEHEERRMT